MHPMGTMCFAVGLIFSLVVFANTALAQGSAANTAKTASPELVGQLTKALSITPSQASGGAGALFGFAKTRLSPADFSKVAASVPGIDGLIKSAPSSSAVKGVAGLSGLGGLGGLASVAGSFQKLGLSPEMAGKFVPVLVKFVESKGGAGVGSLLAGALK
jgi:hypothetical protein